MAQSFYHEYCFNLKAYYLSIYHILSNVENIDLLVLYSFNSTSDQDSLFFIENKIANILHDKQQSIDKNLYTIKYGDLLVREIRILNNNHYSSSSIIKYSIKDKYYKTDFQLL